MEGNERLFLGPKNQWLHLSNYILIQKTSEANIYYQLGRGNGLVVSVLASYSDNPSSNPAEGTFNLYLGGRHSSVDSSVPTILRSRVSSSPSTEEFRPWNDCSCFLYPIILLVRNADKSWVEFHSMAARVRIFQFSASNDVMKFKEIFTTRIIHHFAHSIFCFKRCYEM